MGIENVTAGIGSRIAVLAPLVLSGPIMAPLALPILPLDDGRGVREVLGMWTACRWKKSPAEELPQMYADMMGLAATGGDGGRCVQIAYARRSISRRDSCEKISARPARSTTRSALWAFRMPSAATITITCGDLQQYSGEVVIAVGMPLEALQPLLGEIDLAAAINNEGHAIPEENNLPVYACRKPKMTLVAGVAGIEVWRVGLMKDRL